MNLELFFGKAMAALPWAMQRISTAQRGISREVAEVKVADGTLVTSTDKEVEAFLVTAMSGIDGTQVRGEEGGRSGDGEVTIWIDPLDGTRPFANMCATSTIIITAYHPTQGILATVVAEPSTRRVWMASSTSMTQYAVDGLSDFSRARVWNGPLSRQTTVYLDSLHGFKRDGGRRQIMHDGQVVNLFRGLAAHTGVMMLGSIGAHQALVANGGDRVAAQIATAMSGPWDACGVLLVLQAGGAARAFSVSPERTLVEQDPLQPPSYDMLVSGNSQATVDQLVDILKATF